jgi:hypothetical protein
MWLPRGFGWKLTIYLGTENMPVQTRGWSNSRQAMWYDQVRVKLEPCMDDQVWVNYYPYLGEYGYEQSEFQTLGFLHQPSIALVYTKNNPSAS